MKKFCGTMLILLFLFCMSIPAFAQGDNVVLHTFSNIPWNTKAEDIIDTFYSKSGIVMEDPYNVGFFASKADQQIVFAGKPVDKIDARAYDDDNTLSSIDIIFEPTVITLSKLTSNDEKAEQFITGISDFLSYCKLFSERYGQSDHAYILITKNQKTQAYILDLNTSENDLYLFVQTAFDGNDASKLRFTWNNVTLSLLLENTSVSCKYGLLMSYYSESFYPGDNIGTFDLNTLKVASPVSIDF